ncbi:MAG TPA: hypothetical protein VHL30_00905 [Chlamydiales bacterium]|nr:hypothetical protein [Chlamydiales bacterium]
MAQITAPGSNQNPPMRFTLDNPNCMNRIVQWFRDEETSTVLKVGALALAALALIGSCFLTLPLALWAWREWNVLKIQEGRMTDEEVAVAVQALSMVENSNATTLEKMQAAVGGEAAYNQLPNLELAEDCSYTGYIDWLKPKDLPFPVMKGILIGRPFIAMKIKGEGVITFFQRYSDASNPWTYGTRGKLHFDFNAELDKEDRAIIHQIVVLKNHPHLTLAE